MHIVIIGNGAAGINCARHVRKLSDHRISVISAESEYFYARTALMYIYMGHMRLQDTKPYEDWFWKKNRIELLEDSVTSIDTGQKKLHLESGAAVLYDRLVIATGSRPRMPDLPGNDLPGVQGLYSLQDLAAMEAHTRDIGRAVVIGGGLIGIELAEMLASRNIFVTFLVREKSYWNRVLPSHESGMINRHIREHGIDLRLETEAAGFEATADGRLCAVRTSAGERIECGFAGVAIGVQPNIGLTAGTEIETRRGILVNHLLETSVEHIYAAGDCAEMTEPPAGRKAMEQVWYTARMQGAVLAHTLCGSPTLYRPGHWFNSAKFFDIEYQTYGRVPAHPEGDTDSIYWEDPNGKRCLRISFKTGTRQVTGVHSLGIRMRHHLLQQFLEQKTSVREVVRQWPAVCFDTEFKRTVSEGLRQAWKMKFPNEELMITEDSGWRAFKKVFRSRNDQHA